MKNTQAILDFTKENLDYTNPEGFHRKLEKFLTDQEGDVISEEQFIAHLDRITAQEGECDIAKRLWDEWEKTLVTDGDGNVIAYSQTFPDWLDGRDK